MHNEWQIELEGVKYVSEKKSRGCEGCCFDPNNYLCNLAFAELSCSNKKIIWIKKEQQKEIQEDTSDRTHPDSRLTEVKYSSDSSFTMKIPDDGVIKAAPEQTFELQLPGTKYDNEKLQYSLIPPYALEAVARNLTVGLRKYRERDNWKKVPNAEQRYLDALMRHLEAVRKGEIYDSESSAEDMPHMAAVAVNALFLLEFMLNPELKEQIKENKEST